MNQVRIAESELIINPDGSVYHLNIKPDQLATNIVTVGDPDRVSRVTRHFDSIEFTSKKREFVVQTGSYKGKRITVLSTGMGTDNIEIVMNELDALANIDFIARLPKVVHTPLNIVRIGTSGSLQMEVQLDAQLASKTAIGIDTLMCFYNLPQSIEESETTKRLGKLLMLPFQPYCVGSSDALYNSIAFDMQAGNTLTCPGFYAPQGRQLRLKTKLPDVVNTYSEFSYLNYKLTNFEMETAGYYSLAKLLGHNALSISAIVAHRLTNQFSTQADTVVDTIIEKVLSRL